MCSNKCLVALLVGLLWATSVSAQYVARTVTADADVTGDGRLHVNVRFSGAGKEPVVVRDLFGVSLADIERQADAFQAQLNQVLQDAATLKASAALPVFPVPLVDPPALPIPPTATQVTVSAFSVAFQRFKQQQTAIKLGLLDPADPTVAKARDDLKANFIPEAVSVLDATAVADLPLVK